MTSERKSNGHYRRSTVELQLGAFTVGAFLLSPSVSSWYSFKVRGGQFWKSNLHIVVFCKIALFSWKNLNNLRSKSEKATIKNSDKSYDFKIKEMIFFYPYPSSRCVTVSHLMMLNGAMYPYCSFVCFLAFSWRSGVITTFVHRGIKIKFLFYKGKEHHFDFMNTNEEFLVACTRLYNPLCWSVGWSVRNT